MASYVKHLFFLILLSFTISLQVHARESHFFSKTSRPEEPLTNYNNNNNNGAAFMDQSNSIPSTFTTEFNDNKERDVNGDIPSSFTGEFQEKERNINNFPSSFTSEFNENKESSANDIPSSSTSEFPSKAFNENQEYYYNVNNNIPKEGSYDRNQQYGMSDTRFLENGRYFYDVNAERNRGQYEPMNGNNNVGGFGSWHGANYRNNGAYGYNKEMEGYQNNNQENQKRQDEYYDP